MIKSKILIVLIISIVFNSFLIASNDDYEKHYKKDTYNLYKNFDFLDLNSIQYTQLKEILIQYNENYRKLHEYKEEIEDEIEDILENDNFDKEKFRNILKDIKFKHLELEVNKIEKIHAILSKKQRKKLAKYVEEWELD